MRGLTLARKPCFATFAGVGGGGGGLRPPLGVSKRSVFSLSAKNLGGGGGASPLYGRGLSYLRKIAGWAGFAPPSSTIERVKAIAPGENV